jgi:GTPase SAR1 family protein
VRRKIVHVEHSIMGVYFSKFWRRLFSGSTEFKAIIVGLDNAGKTTTLYKM